MESRTLIESTTDRTSLGPCVATIFEIDNRRIPGVASVEKLMEESESLTSACWSEIIDPMVCTPALLGGFFETDSHKLKVMRLTPTLGSEDFWVGTEALGFRGAGGTASEAVCIALM